MDLEFRRLRAAPDLSLHVRHYWVLAGEALGAAAHPVFPDGCGEIVFNLGPPARELSGSGTGTVQPAAMLVGQMTRPVRMIPGKTMRMVGVKLAPWGAAAILGDESAAVRDATAPLSALMPAMARLGERLDGCIDHTEVGGVLDEAIRACLAGSGTRRLDRLDRLARALGSAPGSSLDAWTRTMGCSGRMLERRFERYVGLAPKELLRLLRFQRALRLSRARPGLSWATIAARTGYSDQTHLGRDFRQFAGAAPSVAASSSTPVSAAFVEPSHLS